jgi:hypothetical protein
MTSVPRKDPIEVEVERLDPGEEEAGSPRGGRSSGSWGPVVVGLVLDLADLLTFGPGMKKIALPIGFVVGFYAGARMNLPLKQRVALGAVGAAYCSLSATSPYPIGTIVGSLYKAGVFGRRA